MSLLDLILSQKFIAIGFGLAGLVLLFAVLLVVIPRVWTALKALRNRPRRTDEPQPVAYDAQGQPIYHPDDAKQVMAERREATQPRVPAAEAPVAEPPVDYARFKPPQEQAAQYATKQASAESTEGTEDSDEPAKVEQKEEEKPASDMQNLLESVFGDDESESRMQTLLEGTEDIKMDDLAELATKIATDLEQKLVPVATH